MPYKMNPITGRLIYAPANSFSIRVVATNCLLCIEENNQMLLKQSMTVLGSLVVLGELVIL